MNSNTNHELRSNLLGSTCNLSDKTHLFPFYNLNSYNSIQFIWVLWCSFFSRCKSANAAKERRKWTLPCMTARQQCSAECQGTCMCSAPQNPTVQSSHHALTQLWELLTGWSNGQDPNHWMSSKEAHNASFSTVQCDGNGATEQSTTSNSKVKLKLHITVTPTFIKGRSKPLPSQPDCSEFT